MSKQLISICTVLLVISAAAGPAVGQSEIGFKGVGGKLGFVSPENLDSAFGFDALCDLGTLAPNWHLEGGLDYWSKSSGNAYVGDFSFRDLAIGAMTKYYFGQEGSKFRPYAGGGLGVHMLKSTVSNSGGNYDNYDNNYYGKAMVGPAGNEDSRSATKIGLDLAGGGRYEASPKVDVLGEIRYRMVSNMSQIAFKAGIVYKLEGK
jgi:opacity protein-like surface antigen